MAAPSFNGERRQALARVRRVLGTLGPAETYLWRSPHVALASLTDFVDKGAVGDQQHAWQATLNGSAVVFTTHP